MIRCHLATLMDRHQLRISDVAKSTGLNRSTVAALQRDVATRVDLPAVSRLCGLLNCSVGELFEFVPEAANAADAADLTALAALAAGPR